MEKETRVPRRAVLKAAVAGALAAEWPASKLAAQPAGSLAGGQDAALKEAPALLKPDERYKADILLIVAHPDDEAMVIGYLARAILDEHKRVAVLYCTRGGSGSNSMGIEMAKGLEAEREIEARRAVATLGIHNVWFMGSPNTSRDTPSQDVLWSLERWDHGASLEEAVRIVRLTRPDVILTMLPAFITGENHGDHQAAGVIATQAFDMAGDPTRFPEQVAFPRSRGINIMNTEGLHTWQPEKLYYFINPAAPGFEKGQGPEYSTTAISPSRGVSYAQIALKAESHHRTQFSPQFMNVARKFIRKPVQLIHGKSHVDGSVTGDVFQAVVPGPIPFASTQGYRPVTHSGLSLQLGGPFAFYRRFYAAHDLDRIAKLFPTPQMGFELGVLRHIPLLIQNHTDGPATVDLTVDAPSGWTVHAGPARYPVPAHRTYPVWAALKAPSQGLGEWHQITWRAKSGGQAIGSVTIRGYLEHFGMPF